MFVIHLTITNDIAIRLLPVLLHSVAAINILMVVGHLTIVDMIAIINTWTRKRVISRQNVCLSNAKVRRNTQCLYFKYKSTTSNVLMAVGHSTVFEMTAIVFRLEYRHLDM